ncbi:MAG: 4-hydroxy-tetrahydrodipicolinate synthase [Robiginitalea sp.]|uniref:4-hydroxy-tetrahydrodipicolinate synthase n=1 Tax=Robiginitalea sp. TaxID=1902411 RepID=UPI003C78BDAA
MRELFTGTGVALITPFTSDLSVDYTALEHLVTEVIEGGVDYLVVLGTTGESVTLNREEKERVLRSVAHTAGGRVPLVAGIGGNSTSAVLEDFKNTDLGGYSGILSVSPYYNKPTQEGIFRHFETLASNSPLPLILYNVPSRTGSNMLPETVIRLANACPNIMGIKEASGDLHQIQDILSKAPEGFLVISGDDLTAVPAILDGGAGVISVLGQGIPGVFTRMIHLARSGKGEEAMAIHNQIAPLVELLFREGNPAGIKALLELRGICSSAVRLPLIAPSKNLRGQIEAFIIQHGLAH